MSDFVSGFWSIYVGGQRLNRKTFRKAKVVARLLKIRDTVSEFANDLSDLDDREPPSGQSTLDAEATAALEGVRPTALMAPLAVLEASQLRLP